mmetsp:Transcript_21246/g.59844  ORF Transcript_21246/g.59844 Transcript_21246/m.59844 type:complete len:320 (+) Transcript_21246:172-1131(+)
MLKNAELLRSLHRVRADGFDEHSRKNAAGALFVLTEKSPVESETPLVNGHIMISYSWANQELALEISGHLKQAGYPVWIDVESMKGSTLEAMAAAVENSFCVVVVISEQYKDSVNCRTEAEFAYACRKPIIPCMVDSSLYRPNGWLGALVGTKLWFDMPFQQRKHSLRGLMHEISRTFGTCPASSPSGQTLIQIPLTSSGEVGGVTPCPETTKKDLLPSSTVRSSDGSSIGTNVASRRETLGMETWDNKAVQDWLVEIALPDYSTVFAECGMDGRSLLELYKTNLRDPSYAHSLLKTSLYVTLLGHRLSLFYEISKWYR